MKQSTNSTMKAVGISLAVGTAAAMASAAARLNSPKRKAKKIMKKAASAMSGIISGMQNMVK